MRDQLPLFAQGRLDDVASAAVEAHVAACADCAAELELLRAVARAYDVPAFDAAQIAAALPAARPVARVGRAGRAFHQQPLWRIAATMTLMIVGAAGVLVMRRADPAGAGIAIGVDSGAVPGGGTVTAESTLAMAPTPPAGTATISFGGNLADLTDAQLEALLAQIERIDGSVSAEPEALATPIVPGGTDAAGRRN